MSAFHYGLGFHLILPIRSVYTNDRIRAMLTHAVTGFTLHLLPPTNTAPLTILRNMQYNV